MATKIVKAIPINVGTEANPVTEFVAEDGREISEPIIMMPDSDGVRWFWDGDPTAETHEVTQTAPVFPSV